MSTVLINASPKKRLSNSAYFMGFSKLFMKSRKNKCTSVKLPRSHKYEELFELVKGADRVVLATPLYVDGLPSHVIRFLAALEGLCRDKGVTFDMYVISNCGFFEGRQTKNLLEQVETWCEKAGVKWCGGIGIGAGEMLGFIRVLPFIYIGIALILFLIELIRQILTGEFSGPLLVHSLQLRGLAIRIGIFLLFSLHAAYTLIRFGAHVRKGKTISVKYSTVVCPKFLFTLFANLFWRGRLCIVNRRPPIAAYHREV